MALALTWLTSSPDLIPSQVLPPTFAHCNPWLIPLYTGRTSSHSFDLPDTVGPPALPSSTTLLILGVAMAGCLALFRRLRRGTKDSKEPRRLSLVGPHIACSADPGWSIPTTPPSPHSTGSASASDDAGSCRFPSGVPTPQGPLSPAGGGYSKDAACLRQEPRSREDAGPVQGGALGQIVLKGHMISGDQLVLFVYINLRPIRLVSIMRVEGGAGSCSVWRLAGAPGLGPRQDLLDAGYRQDALSAR